MGMCIETTGVTTYTIHLTDEDVKLIKEWITQHKDNLPSFNMKENIAYAAKQLYCDGKISFYDERKAVESDFSTENVSWSEFESREPEEILGL